MVVRVGVIGAGMIGTYHIERLAQQHSGARVVAVSDVARDRARRIAGMVGATAHADAHDVVNDEDVDAVVIASPGDTHAEYALACIEAGKPLLSEKPLATTVEDCLAVLDAEIRHGARLLQVGFMRRFDAGYRRVKTAIDDGTIGTPLVAHCIHRNAAAPDQFTSAMVQNDSAIHEIDAARWLFGDEVVAATVVTPRSSPRSAEHLRDPQLVLLETAGGAVVDVEVFVNAQYGYDVRCEVVGSDGTVELETPAIVSVTRGGARGRAVPADWKERFGAAFYAEFEHWIAGVAAGRVTGPSSWDGYAATSVAVACVEALETGERVPISLTERPGLYA
jgi:myo-inositol 2-dehydrogenase / D-chiro-inositol 1-dehydrogenase